MRPLMHSLLKPTIAFTLLLTPVAFNPSFAQSASGTSAIAKTPVSMIPAPAVKAGHSSHRARRTAYHYKLHQKPTGGVPTTLKQ
jgi:hypothetical protein